MTMKSLLGTVSLVLLLGGGSTAAQAQIAIGHLADYSGGTAEVGTPYGQAVARTFAWGNKKGGGGREQPSPRNNQLRHSGATRDRALQEMVGRRQGRGDHGLGHRGYRGADRLRGTGQDPVLLRLLCRGSHRSGRYQRQGETRAV